MNYLGRNLRYLRKKSGLKQEDMLAFLRVTRSTWSNYEIGKTYPNINEIINIARFFGVSLDDIILYDLEDRELSPKSSSRRQYPLTDNIVLAAEPDMIYVLKELKKLKDRLDGLNGEGVQY